MSGFFTETPGRLLLLSGVALGTAAALYVLLRPPKKIRRCGRDAASPRSQTRAGASAGEAEERSADPLGDGKVKKLSCRDTLFVYFGSQSGTAEAFSEELASAVVQEIEELQHVEVVDLEDFDPDAFLAQQFKVLVVATHGEGEPTDNARGFFEWLQRYTKDLREGRTPSPAMQGWCAVFGLGSSDYERFNRMGRRTFKMLEFIEKRQRELHASSSSSLLRLLCPLGVGDAAKALDADFALWRQAHFLPALKRIADPTALQEEPMRTTPEVRGDAPVSPVSYPPLSGVCTPEASTASTPELDADPQRRGDSSPLQGYHAARSAESLEQETREDLSRFSSAASLANAQHTAQSVTAAVERLEKRVASWAKRGEEAPFRLMVGPSRERLLAEQRRLEEEAAGRAGKSLPSLPSLLAQAPHGTSAKFFFQMHALPVNSVRQLRQQVTFSSASAAGSHCAHRVAASETEKELGEPWRTDAPQESTVEVELDLTDCPAVQYRAADNMYCLHKNTAEEITWWHTFLGFKEQGVALNDFVHWVPSRAALASAFPVSSSSSSPSSSPALSYAVPFPTPCTVEEALGFFSNLTGQLPKFAAACLSLWIEDPEERTQWLRLFCDEPAAQQAYEACVRSPLLSLRELLPLLAPSFSRPRLPRLSSSSTFDEDEEAASTQELGLILSLLAAAHAPRAYTIASSPKALARETGTRSVALCVGLVAEQRESLAITTARLEEHGFKIFGSSSAVRSARRGPLFHQEDRLFFGACSSFITQQLRPGDVLKALIKPSSFRLPADVKRPIIMVAAGTGIAPFIAFLREFACLGGWLAPVVLFFGCQRANKDFLYREELLRYKARQDAAEESQGKKHFLTHLFLAFSREPGQPKTYVQHKIAEQRNLVLQLLQEQQATLYICGRTAMAAGVTKTLAHAAAETLGGDEARGNAFVHDLRKSRRIVEEVWA
ncbi:flavodoxin domain-containing protein [Toxoplasma gondii RUB]|uniref:NADPH--hemoprotein reductase n=1 Tax=Toxoplasma gondii RUB TaxID=935652 RepID=A0A086M7P7_TOXGO|nr:flavodoxin domain-containing protein [Toxoplasma gondii RUB]